MTLRLLTLVTFVGIGCKGGTPDSNDTDPFAICGDIDGEGGDTGDVPNLLGNWTVDFGRNLFMEDCGVPGLEAGSETWLDGAMEIRGRVPNNLYATFNGAEERFFGLQANNGGVSFSGIHEDSLGTMYAAFGGMAYFSERRNRYLIEGFAYIGLDSDGDGSIDCTARGEWTAMRSGA